ncbi:type II toxin-antitoxin system ParD family antitoxin [Sphingomonas endophytica]|nr:type II toxin-antitoxin system ParD family antitoxin [Sphingomonas endophytica]
MRDIRSIWGAAGAIRGCAKRREGQAIAPRLREPQPAGPPRPSRKAPGKQALTIFANHRHLGNMATMNISLPDAMKDWVEQQAATGRYSNSSDVVRDLIRREQVRAEKIANMQRLVDEGRASGVSARSFEQVVADTRAAYLAKHGG